MQFSLLIYHTAQEFEMRKNDYNDPHLGARRAYYKALVDAKVYVGANALELPATGTTVRVKDGKCRVWEARRPKPLFCRFFAKPHVVLELAVEVGHALSSMAHPVLQKSRRGGREVPVLEISGHKLPRGHRLAGSSVLGGPHHGHPQ